MQKAVDDPTHTIPSLFSREPITVFFADSLISVTFKLQLSMSKSWSGEQQWNAGDWNLDQPVLLLFSTHLLQVNDDCSWILFQQLPVLSFYST